MKKTTIITGFLGAGKTTYLNHLLKSNPNTKYAIIENEVGEQNIDSELIIRADEELYELNHGCLCCSLNDDLLELLSDLSLRKSEFDELLIEATGIADPSGIADPFHSHPAVKHHFELSRVVCIVDAEQIIHQLETTEEARKQIAFSDIVIINKTDLINEDELSFCVSLLENINPSSQVVQKENNSFPNYALPERKKAISTFSSMNFSYLPLKSQLKTGKNNQFTPFVKSFKHSDISTHTITGSEAVDISAVFQHFTVFLTFQSKDLYRIKGFVAIRGSATKYLLQSVGKRLVIEEFGEWNSTEQKETKLVFIGKNMEAKGLRKLMEKCF